MTTTQFIYYDGATDQYGFTAPHPDIATPDVQPVKNMYFDTRIVAFQDKKIRKSISKGIRWLSLASLVRDFAAGSERVSAPGQVPFALVFKDWHQRLNEHFLVKLGWADPDG